MKFSFLPILNVVANTTLYLAAAVLIILALLVSVVRFYPNLSDTIEAKVETRLAEILHADVTIESLDISRRKPLSQIIVENIRIADRKNPDNAWELRKASVSLHLLKSLLTRSLRVKEVSLEGLDLSVRRDESGDFHVNQTFLLPRQKMQESEGNKYSAVHLSLLDSNIHWLDELTDIDYSFEEIDIAINPISGGYNVFLDGGLPSELGKSLTANLYVSGDFKDLANTEIKFYLKTKQFRLAEIAKRFVGVSGEKVPVVLDSEVWGQFKDSSLVKLRGSMQAENIVVDHASAESELCLSDEYIKQLSMQFDWSNEDRNWRFLANNIRVNTSKKDWPETKVKFKLQRHSLNGKSIFAHVGAMNLGAICNTLHTYSPHIVRFEDQLKQLRFNADIADLFVRIDLEENHRSSLQYKMKFNDAALWTSGGNRTIRGVSGYVEGGDSGGKVLLDSDEIVLHLPDVYPGFDMKLGAQGEVQWNERGKFQEVQSDLLKIYNDDLKMSARLNAKISHENVYVDSQVNISSAKANAVGKYFPLFQKTRTTKKWLTDSIEVGEVTDATLLLRGNMQVFPFHKNPGVFQTNVNVDKGVLEFKKDWPKLENVKANVVINKDHIKITSQQATMFDSKVKKVEANIDSFLKSILKLNGTVDGPGKDLLQFLGDAKLVNEKNSVLDQISLSGDSRLELDFSRSLSKKIDYPVQVSGIVHFLGNTLSINSVGIDLEELGGEISFNADGATGEDLTATINNQIVSLSSQALGDGASELSFSGPFDLGLYLEQKYPRFEHYFSGITNVDGKLYLPSLFKKNNPEKLIVKINSELVGVKASLPEPLNKTENVSLPSLLVFDQKKKSMLWEIGDLITLNFVVSNTNPFSLRLVELGQSQKANLPSNGIAIVGTLEDFSPEEWLTVYDQYQKTASTRTATVMPVLDINIKELQWPKWPAKDVHVVSNLKDDEYNLQVKSSLGSGSIKIPQDKSLPILFDMQSLTLKKTDSERESSKSASLEIDPSKVRPFTLASQQLKVNDLNFKNVKVNALQDGQGLVFDVIKFAAQDLTVLGTGNWKLNAESKPHSSFDLQIESIDIEDSLVDLGFNSALRKGEANADITLQWEGAPYQAGLNKISGHASFDMRDGSVEEIEPGGAGRLLALLNLGAISRRLALDFKDVTNKGFAFNTINGELDLAVGGKLESEKIKIKSSAADITIKGSTNIVNQTYDQNIRVVPAVASGSLPAAGAIVGGPVGAAAGLLAERVASAVGLNKLTKIEYKMTGTWKEPIIEKISKKVEKADLPNAGPPSTP